MGCSSSKQQDAVVNNSSDSKPSSPPPPKVEESVQKQTTKEDETNQVSAPTQQTSTENNDKDNNSALTNNKPEDLTNESSSIEITPHAGYVIKSKNTKTNNKMFINVMHHKSIKDYNNNAFITIDAKWTIDKKGEQCMVYGVIIPSKLLKACSVDEDKQYETSLAILNLLNATFPHALLDLDFKLPKINRGFMGESIDTITFERNATAVTISNNNYSTKSVEEVNKEVNEPIPEPPKENDIVVPPVVPTSTDEIINNNDNNTHTNGVSTNVINNEPVLMKGWLKKQGHVVHNWKSRYCVLELGIFNYYSNSSDEYPYGTDLKGQICVGNYIINNNNELPENCIILKYNNNNINQNNNYKKFDELVLSFENNTEKDQWIEAINNHTNYIINKNTIQDEDSEGESDFDNNPREFPSYGDRKVSVTTLKASKDLSRFEKLLKPGESIAYSGVVGKPNPVGIQWIRELLLISPTKRMVYCDVKSIKQKGEIQWKKYEAPPTLTVIDEYTFEIVDCRNKVYRFISKDEDQTAEQWIAAINNMDDPF